jgi:ketosteroid isomerase-like protein
MSAEDIEILEDGYAAFNRGDADEFMALLDPEIEWRMPAGGADTSVYHRYDGIRELLKNTHEVWGEYRAEPEEMIDLGDQVLVLARAIGRGRGSGAEVEAPVAHLWRMRNGRGIPVQMYVHRDEALEAIRGTKS